jgi:hypothetical protein
MNLHRILLLAPGDVSEASHAARAVVNELNAGLARERGWVVQVDLWEDLLPPGQGLPPISELLEPIHCVVAILWAQKRLADTSYDAIEILKAATGRSQSVWMYFSRAALDPDLAGAEFIAIREYREASRGLNPKTFRTSAEFERLFRKHLEGFLLAPPRVAVAVGGSGAAAAPAIAVEAALHADEIRYELVIQSTGRAELHGCVSGLRVLTGEIRSLNFRLQSTAGILHEPEPVRVAGRAPVMWKSSKPAIPEDGTWEEILESSRLVQGRFELYKPLTPSSPPLSFEFTLTMHNAYATSTAESNFFYAGGGLKDFDDVPLEEPCEYFFRPIWLPTGRLSLCITVPGPLPDEPELLAYRRSGGAQLASVRNGELVLPADDPQAWDATDAPSERLTTVTSGPDSAPEVTFQKTIENPGFASGYRFKWGLPHPTAPLPLRDPGVSTAMGGLVQLGDEMESMHASGPQTPAAVMCWTSFARFAARLAQRYAGRNDTFDVSLSVFNSDDNRLRIVLGWLKGKLFPQPYWRFRLPVGIGTAGEAFKTQRLTWYVKPTAGHGQLGIYLPVENHLNHSAILAVPVVHPRFHGAALAVGDAERQALTASYLCGVISIGSRLPTSELFHIGDHFRSEVELGIEAKNSKVLPEIQAIAADCQEAFELVLARLDIEAGG